MSEARIGRILVASLHQAIADILPTRLDFYENWLNVSGMREGTIGLGPLFAVLSFLRAEGTTYGAITSRAGEHAAEWTVRGLPGLERRLIRALPLPIRMRVALRTARSLIRDTYPGTRALIRVRRGTATVDLRGSLFCEVRELASHPLCAFYVAAIARILQLFALNADVQVVECRAAGVRRACILNVALQPSLDVARDGPEPAEGPDAVPVEAGTAEKL
jgi:bacteriochlorophyll 4-vinyl reductase